MTTRRWLKIKNHLIWTKIKDIITTKQLTIDFKKVVAHTGVKENKIADMLAKKGLEIKLIVLSREKKETINRVYQYKS